MTSPSNSLHDPRLWPLRNALEEHAQLVVSLGVSLGEAAFRGHDVALRVHLQQIRAVLSSAIEALRQIEAANGSDRECA